MDAQKEELDQLRRRIVSHVEYEARLEASLGELEGRLEAMEQKLGSMSHWADTVVPGLAESVASLQESMAIVNGLVDARANTLSESICKLEDACNREFSYLERDMERLRAEKRTPSYMDSTSDDMVALGLTTHSGKRHVIE